jgi:putative phosphoesterase
MIQLDQKGRYRIGVISDTHGRLPEAVLEHFAAVDVIVHAGDIGDPAILERLKRLALVVAVRGNMDAPSWFPELPEVATVAAGDIALLVTHDLHRLGSHQIPSTTRVIISGHTHQAHVERRNGILFLNPGSAGQGRYRRPLSIAVLRIEPSEVDAQFYELPATQM